MVHKYIITETRSQTLQYQRVRECCQRKKEICKKVLIQIVILIFLRALNFFLQLLKNIIRNILIEKTNWITIYKFDVSRVEIK